MPFSLIRCSSSKVAFCSCVEWGWHIYNIVESESDPLTRRPVDVFEKEPLKGNSEVHLHTPTKFGEDRSKDLGGDREQTDRQTDKRCSIYSMMIYQGARCSMGEMHTYPVELKNKQLHTTQIAFLTLTVLVVTIDAQSEGMGDVGSARYEPALLPPCPTIRVLSYSS